LRATYTLPSPGTYALSSPLLKVAVPSMLQVGPPTASLPVRSTPVYAVEDGIVAHDLYITPDKEGLFRRTYLVAPYSLETEGTRLVVRRHACRFSAIFSLVQFAEVGYVDLDLHHRNVDGRCIVRFGALSITAMRYADGTPVTSAVFGSALETPVQLSTLLPFAISIGHIVFRGADRPDADVVCTYRYRGA
jgi:hypothetical protein